MSPGWDSNPHEVALHIDWDDFERWLREFKKLKHPRDPRNYRLYAEKHLPLLLRTPEVVAGFPPKKRSWILRGLYSLREYLSYLYARERNDAYLELREEIMLRIEAYQINKGVGTQASLKLVKRDTVERLMKDIGRVKGAEGAWYRFLLYTGLREEEAKWLKANFEKCQTESYGNVELIVFYDRDGRPLLKRGRKNAWFTLVPSSVLHEFLSCEDMPLELLRASFRSRFNENLRFLRKVHYNILKGEMKPAVLNALQGRVKETDARHYLLHFIDEMVEKYRRAWGLVEVKP